MELRLLEPDDVPARPRSGAPGTTRELLVWPGGEHALDARVSLVDVPADGPFASLAGHERVLMPVEGSGLTLRSGSAETRTRLRRLEILAVSGDEPLVAELVDGPVRVLNVTTRRGRARAGIEALRLGTRQVRESLRGGQCLVHALRGGAEVRATDEEDEVELEEGASLWLLDVRAGEELALEGTAPGSEVLVIELDLGA